MSIKHLPAQSALAAALAVALLLGGCSTAPKQGNTGAGALPESNEPDLVAQLRARMASGNLPRKTKTADAAPVSARSDTSNVRAASTVDPAKLQAAAAVGADYARALTLMKAGSDAEALSLLRQIGSKVPQFSGPLVNQAVILIKQGKHAEAEKALHDALKINPRNPFAGNLLGIALREQGKFTDAKAAYEAALAIDPSYAKAHFNLGVLADLYLQDLPLALSHYERYQGLQSNPDPAVANWIVDLQKRTGVYKAPPRPVAPAPVAEPEEEAPAPAATETPATAAPAAGAAVVQEQKNPS